MTLAEYKRKYVNENREEIRGYSKKYYEKHKEERQEYAKNYYYKNRQAVLARIETKRVAERGNKPPAKIGRPRGIRKPKHNWREEKVKNTSSIATGKKQVKKSKQESQSLPDPVPSVPKYQDASFIISFE